MLEYINEYGSVWFGFVILFIAILCRYGKKSPTEVMTDKVVLIADGDLESLRHQDIFMHQQNLLHLASQHSQECLDILLFGPLQNVYRDHLKGVDYFHKTPMHLAAANATSNCAGKLLSFTFDLKLKDWEGNTPLHIACQQG